MHGKTPKLHTAPAGAHSTPKHRFFRHGHAPTASVSGAKRMLLPLLLVAQLMVILDITAVNIALPTIARDLDISGSAISWTITSYSLIFGSLLLLGGRAADLLGRRRMFLSGLGIFTVASFASALAGTAGALFVARAGQGLGAALLSPAALAIVMSAFQGRQRAKALAAWGAVGGAGAAIGVLAGGVLTELDWRLIFYVNLPSPRRSRSQRSGSSRPIPRSRAGRASTSAVPPWPRRVSAQSSSRSPRARAPGGRRPRRT
jgi:MFS family permease